MQVSGELLLIEGNELENYPIDYNPVTKEQESNGGIEHVIEYGGEKYLVVTDLENIPYEVFPYRKEM